MGEAFSLPELTLKAGGTTLTGKSYTYESSNESVATVASDGTVTLVGEGTTNITATYAGDGTYSSSSAVYALTVEAAENRWRRRRGGDWLHHLSESYQF